LRGGVVVAVVVVVVVVVAVLVAAVAAAQGTGKEEKICVVYVRGLGGEKQDKGSI
jgi:hypothetical protein